MRTKSAARRKAHSLSHGTRGERAGERGRLRVESKIACVLERRGGPARTVFTRTQPLSPTLSPEYVEEGVRADGPRRSGSLPIAHKRRATQASPLQVFLKSRAHGVG